MIVYNVVAAIMFLCAATMLVDGLSLSCVLTLYALILVLWGRASKALVLVHPIWSFLIAGWLGLRVVRFDMQTAALAAFVAFVAIGVGLIATRPRRSS